MQPIQSNMSEKYRMPKLSWLVPFGPIRGVSHVSLNAMEKFRQSIGAKYSHGELLRRMEWWFEESERASSQFHKPRPNCEYFRTGKSGDAGKPATLFIVRDGAIISIRAVSRSEWETMPG